MAHFDSLSSPSSSYRTNPDRGTISQSRTLGSPEGKALKNLSERVTEQAESVVAGRKRRLFDDDEQPVESHKRLRPIEEMGANKELSTSTLPVFKIPSRPSPERTLLPVPTPASALMPMTTFEELSLPLMTAASFATPSPPPTPQRKTPQRRENGFQQLEKQIQRGFALVGSSKLTLDGPPRKGSYFDVYRFSSEREIDQDLPNERLLVKFFNSARTGKDSETSMNGFLTSILSNYNEAKRLGLPVAKICNEATAKQDRSLIQVEVQEKVNLDNPLHLSQLKNFFLTSLREKVAFDLLPANLGVDSDQVTLFDFVEESDQELGENAHLIFINEALKGWTRHHWETHGHDFEATEAFLTALTAGFEKFGYNLENNQWILAQETATR